MSKNPLLVKGEVGKAKPTIYNLPNQDFAYGKGYIKDKEGAKEVSMTWNFHQSTRDPLPVVDFKKKNKDKIVGNPKEIKAEKKETKKEEKKLVIDENFAFGLKVKPSTPIGKLLANEFGDESEKALKEMQEKQKEEKIAHKKGEVKQNKTQLLKTKQRSEEKTKENEKPKVFTLKKFQNIEPKVKTNKAASKPSKGENKEATPKENEEVQLVEKYFAENK